jgi:hypothetical protein
MNVMSAHLAHHQLPSASVWVVIENHVARRFYESLAAIMHDAGGFLHADLATRAPAIRPAGSV